MRYASILAAALPLIAAVSADGTTTTSAAAATKTPTTMTNTTTTTNTTMSTTGPDAAAVQAAFMAIPACAQACPKTAIAKNATNCALDDGACICKYSGMTDNAISKCIQSTCSKADQATAETTGIKYCALFLTPSATNSTTMSNSTTTSGNSTESSGNASASGTAGASASATSTSTASATSASATKTGAASVASVNYAVLVGTLFLGAFLA